MKKTVTALGLLMASANVAALPLVDFWAGGYSWSTEYSGNVSADPINLDLESNLKLGDSDNTVIWAAFEHAVPVIPNIQIRQTNLETSGNNGSVTTDFTFGGKTYDQNLSLDSNINLDHTDYTLYWGLPLPVVTVDFGLNIRKFEGDLVIDAAGVSGDPVVIDAPVPMLFGRVGAELPFTGLAVMAEANYIGYEDTNHMDYQVVVRYTLPFLPVLDLNVEAGYRAFELNIDPDDFGGDSDDLMADIDMSGIFFGVSAHL